MFALFGWAVGIASLSDNSFFWHLRTGEYILDHGIPHHDVFSFTAPGTKWVAQSWLAELTYGAPRPDVRRVRHPRASSASSAPRSGCSRTASRCGSCADRPWRAGSRSPRSPAIYTLWSERPLLLGVLFLLVLLWVVEVPDSLVGRHPLIVLPVLIWLWVERARRRSRSGSPTSGCTWSVGGSTGAAVATGGNGCSLDRRGDRLFAVSFVNPYGVELVLFPIELLSRGEILSHVIEWRSPDFRKIYGIALGTVDRGVHRRAGAWPEPGLARDLIVTLPMLFLALWALRNLAIAPLIGLPVVARAFARDEERPDGSRRTIVVGALALDRVPRAA